MNEMELKEIDLSKKVYMNKKTGELLLFTKWFDNRSRPNYDGKYHRIVHNLFYQCGWFIENKNSDIFGIDNDLGYNFTYICEL